MDIFILLFLPMFGIGDTETQNSILQFLEYIKVLKYADKIMLECSVQ